MNAEPRYCCVLQVVRSMKVHVRNAVGDSHGEMLADAHVECRIPCWTKLLLLRNMVTCVHVHLPECESKVHNTVCTYTYMLCA